MSCQLLNVYTKFQIDISKHVEDKSGKRRRTDGRTDGRTLPRHNTSRFSNGRIKCKEPSYAKGILVTLQLPVICPYRTNHLTHCGLVIPYGKGNLGQHWLGYCACRLLPPSYQYDIMQHSPESRQTRFLEWGTKVLKE